ncbi:hypothetical protein CLV29_2704 [Naumannella halotolerans]|uniref:Uncharacterized protein n=2 Tax=Naumannella halotolerans TaxID=993414 RepID=A0A4R7J4I7_9ACTN|nr:hypothetical protein CLV29_2704 [Naumannella halotolerans]
MIAVASLLVLVAVPVLVVPAVLPAAEQGIECVKAAPRGSVTSVLDCLRGDDDGGDENVSGEGTGGDDGTGDDGEAGPDPECTEQDFNESVDGVMVATIDCVPRIVPDICQGVSEGTLGEEHQGYKECVTGGSDGNSDDDAHAEHCQQNRPNATKVPTEPKVQIGCLDVWVPIECKQEWDSYVDATLTPQERAVKAESLADCVTSTYNEKESSCVVERQTNMSTTTSQVLFWRWSKSDAFVFEKLGDGTIRMHSIHSEGSGPGLTFEPSFGRGGASGGLTLGGANIHGVTDSSIYQFNSMEDAQAWVDWFKEYEEQDKKVAEYDEKHDCYLDECKNSYNPNPRSLTPDTNTDYWRSQLEELEAIRSREPDRKKIGDSTADTQEASLDVGVSVGGSLQILKNVQALDREYYKKMDEYAQDEAKAKSEKSGKALTKELDKIKEKKDKEKNKFDTNRSKALSGKGNFSGKFKVKSTVEERTMTDGRTMETWSTDSVAGLALVAKMSGKGSALKGGLEKLLAKEKERGGSSLNGGGGGGGTWLSESQTKITVIRNANGKVDQVIFGTTTASLAGTTTSGGVDIGVDVGPFEVFGIGYEHTEENVSGDQTVVETLANPTDEQQDQVTEWADELFARDDKGNLENKPDVVVGQSTPESEELAESPLKDWVNDNGSTRTQTYNVDRSSKSDAFKIKALGIVLAGAQWEEVEQKDDLKESSMEIETVDGSRQTQSPTPACHAPSATVDYDDSDTSSSPSTSSHPGGDGHGYFLDQSKT